MKFISSDGLLESLPFNEFSVTYPRTFAKGICHSQQERPFEWEVTFVVVVQLFSCVQLYNPMGCSRPRFLSFTISLSLLKFMSIESVMPSNHLIRCHPLLLLPTIFPSIRVFFNESALCIRCPKYWSFSFSISPSKEYSGLISFRINWFDLLAIQRTLKSLQHNSSKASVLWHSAFFMVQLSHPYMTTGKIIALTRQTLVGKVMSAVICCLGFS